MSEDDRNQEDVQRGVQAAAILNNPLFAAVFEEYAADIIRAWRNSDPIDSQSRERAWHRLVALEVVQARLREAIDSGQVAALQMKKDAKNG